MNKETSGLKTVQTRNLSLVVSAGFQGSLAVRPETTMSFLDAVIKIKL